MELYYNGRDITGRVMIKSARHRETSGGRCDLTEIEFYDPAIWHAWQPQENDEVNIILDGYTTGKMYVNTIYPKDGAFTMLLTSAPARAGQTGYASFENKRIFEIMTVCAAECGMGSALYGVDEAILFPYLIKNNESMPKFIGRILEWEGAAFKTVNGQFAAINIDYMQNQEAQQRIEISADMDGVEYIKRNDARWKSVTVLTPYAEGKAVDSRATGNMRIIRTDLPALDNGQAKRWARGVLLSNNRRAERIIYNTEFNRGLGAMTRVDITGQAWASGKWIVDEVEHDLINLKSEATLFRCITSIQ